MYNIYIVDTHCKLFANLWIWCSCRTRHCGGRRQTAAHGHQAQTVCMRRWSICNTYEHSCVIVNVCLYWYGSSVQRAIGQVNNTIHFTIEPPLSLSLCILAVCAVYRVQHCIAFILHSIQTHFLFKRIYCTRLHSSAGNIHCTYVRCALYMFNCTRTAWSRNYFYKFCSLK